MKKQIIFLALITVTIILSFSTISASDLNITDLESTAIDENVVLESDLNDLSDNTLGNSEKLNTSINIESTSPYYMKSNLTVNLKDNNGKNIVNQLISVKIGSKNYNKTTDFNGLVNIPLTQVGNFQLKITYLGSDEYNGSQLTSNLSVLKSINSSNLKIYYKSSTPFTASFLTSQGKVLKNTNVKLTLNGKKYTVKTNGKGVASLKISLKPGTYSLSAYNPSTAETQKYSIRVLSTISASDISKVYTDSKKFKAKFLKSDGKALSKKYIKFKINKKTYRVKTNKNGEASLKLTALRKGTYKIISYNNDGLTKTNNVKVYNKASTTITGEDYLFLKSDKKVIKAKLLDKFGYAPSSGKVVKFTINKKTYSKKTNNNGIASLTLPTLSKGEYTVKYNFAGNNLYSKSSSSNKVIILQSKSTALSVKSTTSFGQGAKTQFKVALTSNGIAIPKKSITLKINNKTYTKTSDGNGIVSQTIDLNIGNYTVDYSFKGDSKLNSANGSVPITVNERIETNIKWMSETSLFSGTQNIKVLLCNNASKPIPSADVCLTVNSKTYTVSTDSNGYATFILNLNSGTFSMTVKYTGDNDLKDSVITKSITVKSKYYAIPVEKIIAAASSLKSYYETNKKIPSTININGAIYTASEFLYLMSQAIVNLGNSNTSDITAISVSNPTSPNGNGINSKTLSKVNYLALASHVLNFIKTNKKAPNYASSTLGKIVFDELLDSFSRILDYYHTNKTLPNNVVITWVALDNINSLANWLTSGLSSDKDKANALFLWVRDNIDYSFYYNTVKGASKTLSSGTGNCCDQAQLLVALARASGLTARFATGYCKFISGASYGHVWVQIKIDGTWHALDTTSSRNTFSAIKNWNTASYKDRGTYTTLPY